MVDPANRPIDRLILAVMQEQDAEVIYIKLHQSSMYQSRIPSSGGLLGQRSVTLLIGANHTQEAEVVEIIRQACRPRIEYVTLPIEGSPIPMPSPTPITVGGATVFSFEVELFEEF